MDVKQERRMVQDRSEWKGLMRGNELCIAQVMKPQTLMRCHSYMKDVGGSPFVAEPAT